MEKFKLGFFILCKVDLLASKLFFKIGLRKTVGIKCKGLEGFKIKLVRKVLFHWKILSNKLIFLKNTRIDNISCVLSL